MQLKTQNANNFQLRQYEYSRTDKNICHDIL